MKSFISFLIILLLSCGCTSSQIANGDGDAQNCQTDAECKTDNPCLVGVCKVGGVCDAVPQVDALCDDGNSCTENDRCDATGQCTSGPAVKLSSNNCEVCTCDEKTGVSCIPAPVGAECDDGECCTLGDSCQPCDPKVNPDCTKDKLTCIGAQKQCNDDNECTVDQCICGANAAASCNFANAAENSACDFSPNDCTQGDKCVEGQCIVGTPLPLDDQNPCTKDLCIKGQLQHQPLTSGQCDDGNECTTDDSCVLGACVGGKAIECTMGECVSSAECINGQGCVVTHKPSGAKCDDENACTIEDSCNETHECIGNGNINCDDGNPCTADSCATDTGCQNVASAELDGLTCPAPDACAAAGLCKNGACVGNGPSDCNDNNPCTNDICDPENGCSYTNNTLPCNDGDPCTTTDTCQNGQCNGSGKAGTLDFACNKANAIDTDGKCCCYSEDPTGKYKSGHVVDLGAVYNNIEIECCLTPGFSSGCKDTAFFDVSKDGVTWTSATSFATSSAKTSNGGWKPACDNIAPAVPFRYVRGGNNKCYVDHFKCSLPCGATDTCTDDTDCDDQNPCTQDSCDVNGDCTHEKIESANCMVLKGGNNLISFGRLPTDPTVSNVFGKYAPMVQHILSENKWGYWLGEQWIGNLQHLERTAGYWIFMKLPAGTPWVAIPLTGAPTDPDVKYPLHQGVNIISFAGLTPTAVPEALKDKSEKSIDFVVGQGIALFKKEGDWVGSLTALKINKGYEISAKEAIPQFSFECPECDNKTDYIYGCTHPSAKNYSAAVDIDDQSCAFELPEDWKQPDWGQKKDQAFLLLDKLRIDSKPLNSKDAVGAFHQGKGVGFGFVNKDVVTLAISGVKDGDEINFKVYDADQKKVSDLILTPAFVWKKQQPVVAGCTDPNATNYSKWATVSTNVCE